MVRATLGTILLAWLLSYLPLALRCVYGGSWVKTLLKLAALGFLYAATFILVSIPLILYVVLSTFEPQRSWYVRLRSGRRLRMKRWIHIAAMLAIVIALSSSLSAQWAKYPTKGVPRTADGAADMNAPAPRTADGKPDLSGNWVRFAESGRAWGTCAAASSGDASGCDVR